MSRVGEAPRCVAFFPLIPWKNGSEIWSEVLSQTSLSDVEPEGVQGEEQDVMSADNLIHVVHDDQSQFLRLK